MFQQINCSENQNSESLEFPSHTTEKYIYKKTISQQDHQSLYSKIFGRYPNGISITDNTSEDLLSHRVTRKRVEIKTENGVSFITTETWTSRNPSYVTWVNGALVIAAIAGIVLGATTINSAGNIGAAGIEAFGNIGSGYMQGVGNAVSGIARADKDIQNIVGEGFMQAMKNQEKIKNVITPAA